MENETLISNICIRAININKKYKSNIILDNLNICIQKSKIYALLGPSGIGKTTLLKCLIGVLKIDSGTISVLGEQENNSCEQRIPLNQLGYLPQETCLFDELNISETLRYFAKLYQINQNDTNTREEFWIKFLDLPSSNRLIKMLSTGQKKRVSFACSLIHNPSVLILDEPTIGLDPLLRKKIWDHLTNLSTNHGTTIIVTTHYIDEARHANNVGFMRHGKIIEENDPNELLRIHNKIHLEDVFQEICSKNDTHVQKILEKEKEVNETRCNGTNAVKKFKSNLSMIDFKQIKTQLEEFNPLKISSSRIGALLQKDMAKCKRNKSLLIVQFLVPIIQIMMFCLCIGKDLTNLKIGILNEERLDNTTIFKIGERFVNKLDSSTFNKQDFHNFDTAIKAVKKGDLWALIKIDKNFSREIIISLNERSLSRIFENQLHVYLDNTNHQISYTIRDGILKALFSLVDDYMQASSNVDNDLQMPTHNYPVNFAKPIYGSEQTVFTHFMAPGIAITVVFFLSVAATASNFVLERRLGLLERSFLSGVKAIELLITQYLVYSILLIIQIAIVLILLFLVFKMPLRGSLILVISLIFLQGFNGLCYGLFISSLCTSEESVIQLTLASFYPMLLMSGIIWPVQGQPQILAFISQYLPFTYAVDALRSILEKGWGLMEAQVLIGFGTTFAWIFLFSIGFLILFSIKQ